MKLAFRGQRYAIQGADRRLKGGVGLYHMPKIKTQKATAKRFKVTGSGKLRRRKGHASHLRRKKSKRAKRELKQDLPVSKAERKRIKRILGLRSSH